MTFLEWLKTELSKCGLFDSMIEEVVPIIINHPTLQSTMSRRWDDDLSGYPQFEILLWMSICPIVLEYVDQKCPQAWFRAIFDLNDPIHKMARKASKESDECPHCHGTKVLPEGKGSPCHCA